MIVPMSKKQFYTSSEVADELGIARRTVNWLALTHDVGTVFGQQRAFTRADIRTMRRLRRENPRGRPRKEPATA